MTPGPKLKSHEIEELLRDQKGVLVMLTMTTDPALLFPDGDWQLLFTSTSICIWKRPRSPRGAVAGVWASPPRAMATASRTIPSRRTLTPTKDTADPIDARAPDGRYGITDGATI